MSLGLLVIRIVFGLTFAVHGAHKLFGTLGGNKLYGTAG
ncbi:DoxX family membrane protein [Geobacillus subterraneus]